MKGHNGDFTIHIFFLCVAVLQLVGFFFNGLKVLSGCMSCDRHPGTPALIHNCVLEVIIFAVSGDSRPLVSIHLCVCVCVCLPGWPARTFGCTPSPMEDYRKWQIKGLSLAAWQRTENYSRSRRCVWMCACVRANMCVHVCVRAQILRGDG